MEQIIEFFTEKSFLQNIFSALIGTGTALFVFYLTLDKKEKTKKKNCREKLITELETSKT